MARKIHVRDFGPRRHASRITNFKLDVQIGAATHSKKNRYYAEVCINKNAVGRGKPGRGIGGRVTFDSRCGTGSGPAPRRALAAAMKDLASSVVKRSSAFKSFGSPKGRQHRGAPRRRLHRRGFGRSGIYLPH